ncbi:hypothetical protein BSKO_10543 [Bryopsis sp. KO-2023]|nr:hypothetical protein BSKO_10543 [Bryopsis sp. KO-2023]
MISKVVVVVLTCVALVEGQQSPERSFSESPGFAQLCQRLMQQKITELQGGGGASGDTTVARTVADDGVAISVENNPQNVANNTVVVKPSIFNIAAINLKLTSTEAAMFLPLNGQDMNALAQRSQAAAAGAKMGKEEGINVFVPMDALPKGFRQCINFTQFSPHPVPAAVRMATMGNSGK